MTKHPHSRYRRVKPKNQTLYQIVLDKHAVLWQRGGQVGDTGVWSKSSNERIPVVDTEKENNLTYPYREPAARTPRKLRFMACVDTERRAAANNHSATHLLEALREGIGRACRAEGFAGDARNPAFRLLTLPEGDGRGNPQGGTHR